jgi:hypothetical protein
MACNITQAWVLVNAPRWLGLRCHCTISHTTPIAGVGARPMTGEPMVLEQCPLDKKVPKWCGRQHCNVVVRFRCGGTRRRTELMPHSDSHQLNAAMGLPWVGIRRLAKGVLELCDRHSLGQARDRNQDLPGGCTSVAHTEHTPRSAEPRTQTRRTPERTSRSQQHKRQC